MKPYFVFAMCVLALNLLAVVPKGDGLDYPLPVDPNVKIGKLENGFTYYIRNNKKPENRVEMRLAVNAGSILEDDDQLGLAHFTEHMAFNGSKHFEKNELISYLQTIGVDFGPDLNAYTSFDETVYMLTIPSDSMHLVDKGFLVMDDWAHGLSFEDEEIDKERGVIIEEWRIGRGANQRMYDKFLPVLFKESQYANRLPIGKKDIIENFEYDVIKRFYRDWYRPDLMAFIVVGDIDVDYAEKKIKEHFGDMEMPAEARERKEFDVPDHKKTLSCIATDKEASYTLVRLYYKHPTEEEGTAQDYLRNLKYSCFTGMLNQRLKELTEQAEPPFMQAGMNYGDLWARTKKAYSGYAVVKDDGVEKGLKALLEENARVQQYGFTQGELDRYKLNLLKNYERAYNERDKTESNRLVGEYIRNYLEGEPIPGIEFEYKFTKEHIDKITLEDVNALGEKFITDENKVISVFGPEKIDLELNEDQLLAWAGDVKNLTIEPYEDKLASTELMAQVPQKGSIIKKEAIESIDAEKVTLSNGIVVYLKKTNFKNDEVIFRGVSYGGTSLYPDEEFYTAIYTDDLAGESGVSEFSNSDLSKVLAGKTVRVNTGISKYRENINASCRPVDMETMFQLIHLKMTTPRADEDAFVSFKNKMKGYVQNLKEEPMYYFYDKYGRIVNQDHPRGEYIPEVADFDKIDFKRSIDIYKERFADANDFKYIIVGAFDKEEIYKMLEQYVATLPVVEGEEMYKDLNIRPPKGYKRHAVYKGADEKSMTNIYMETEAEYNENDALMLAALGEILQIKFYEILREEMSGVYGVRVNTSFGREPYEKVSMSINYPSSPENVDSLARAALDIVKAIQENGVEEKNITKAKNTMKRGKEKNMEQNNYWLNQITDCVLHDKDFAEIKDYEKFEKITSDEIQRVAKKYFNVEEYLQVSLYPEAMKPE